MTNLENPENFQNENKDYRNLVLANGLHVLLVTVPHTDDATTSTSSEIKSDSCAAESGENDDKDTSSHVDTTEEEDEEKLAEIALAVGVGSFSDPSEYQGMAQLLEHMMFMGSKKYPTENALDNHIEKCDGICSVTTINDATLYCVDMPKIHLESCMDYLTSAFKAPLLLKEAMQRALEKIESNFQEKLQDHNTRRNQLLASLANRQYPHSKFAWGNLKSLKEGINEDDLHRDLLEFFHRHYSAHRMHLCVKAGLTLDKLEDLVVKYFSDIPSNNVEAANDFSAYQYHEAFCPEFHNEVVFVKPEGDVCKLELTWVLPDYTKAYKFTPANLVAFPLRAMEEGSLGDYLKKRSWAIDVTADIQSSNFHKTPIYNLLTLTIELTDSGFKHLDEVLTAISAYIKLISTCGALKPVHDEMTRLFEGICKLSECMFSDAQDLIIRYKNNSDMHKMLDSMLFFEYDEAQIQNIIRHLNEFKFNIMITSKTKYNDDIVYDRKEKWFDTVYTSIKVPQKWQDLWKNCQQLPELQLPKTNPFTANDFHLFWVESGKPEIPLDPKKLLQSDVCELWFRPDDTTNNPFVIAFFSNTSPLLGQSVKNAVMHGLYAELMQAQLKYDFYLAERAAMDYNIEALNRIMYWTVSGFNDKFHLAVDVVANTFISLHKHITNDKFDACKEKLKKDLFKYLLNPKTSIHDIYEGAVIEHHWTLMEKYKCIDDISLNDMLEFAQLYTQELHVKTLIEGNFTEELSLNVANSLMTTLKSQKIQEPKFIERRHVQLPQGSHYIRCNALNENYAKTHIENNYQCGPTSEYLESILDLYTTLLQDPVLDTLRTEEKLDDSLKVETYRSYGFIIYSIRLSSQESNEESPVTNHLDERIESFRSKILNTLVEMSDEDFEKVRKSALKKMKPYHKYVHRVACHLDEIVQNQYRFDRYSKHAELLRSLKKEDLIAFCENENKNIRKLSIQIIGNVNSSSCPKPEEKTDEDVEENQYEDAEENEDNMDSEEFDEDLYNALSNKIDLKYIPREGDATTIVDIKEFKKKLLV